MRFVNRLKTIELSFLVKLFINCFYWIILHFMIICQQTTVGKRSQFLSKKRKRRKVINVTTRTTILIVLKSSVKWTQYPLAPKHSYYSTSKENVLLLISGPCRFRWCCSCLVGLAIVSFHVINKRKLLRGYVRYRCFTFNHFKYGWRSSFLCFSYPLLWSKKLCWLRVAKSLSRYRCLYK